MNGRQHGAVHYLASLSLYYYSLGPFYHSSATAPPFPFQFSLAPFLFLALSLSLPLSLFLPPSLFSCCLSHSLSPSLTRTIEPCHGLYSAVSLSSFLFPFPFFFLVLSPSLLPPFFPSLSRWFLYLPLISRLFRREIRFMVHWQDRVTCSYGYTRLFIYTYTCTYQGPVDIL